MGKNRCVKICLRIDLRKNYPPWLYWVNFCDGERYLLAYLQSARSFEGRAKFTKNQPKRLKNWILQFFELYMFLEVLLVRARSTLILQLMLKAWNFQNFLIESQETFFLTETLDMVSGVMMSSFFGWNFLFFQNLSTYTSLEQ